MKAKKIFAAGALAAVLLSSTTALAIPSIPVIADGGLWWHGTTDLDGGGTVFSYYFNANYNYSYASVINSRGWFASDTKLMSMAKAHATAYPSEIDHAYYNFWN